MYRDNNRVVIIPEAVALMKRWNVKDSLAKILTCPCGVQFITRSKRVLWHSAKCRKQYYRVVDGRLEWIKDRTNRVVLYAFPGTHTKREWLMKLVLARYLCYWCELELSGRNITKDHLQPLSRGGSNSIDNLVPSCRPCNSSKGSQTAAEFRSRLEQKALAAALKSTDDSAPFYGY
jgi:5-methylcytosine-specific restriction endonuclease McrA